MKHFISLAAAAATMLIAASCSVKEDRIQCQAPVTVAVNTFSVSQEDIPLTKAQSVAEYTDSKPANVKDVRITLSKGGTTFSPVTGFAANDAGFVNSISLAEAATGTSKLRTTFFIGAIEENLDVKAEVLDEDATVLNTINVPAVPFKRKRATFLKGSLYSANLKASFAVETGFESDLKIDF